MSIDIIHNISNILNIYVKTLCGDYLHINVEKDYNIFVLKTYINNIIDEYNPHFQNLIRNDMYILKNKDKCGKVLKDNDVINLLVDNQYDKNNWKYLLDKYYKKKNKDTKKVYIFFLKDYQDILSYEKRFEVYTIKFLNGKWNLYLYDLNYTQLLNLYRNRENKFIIEEEELLENYTTRKKIFDTEIDPYFNKLYNNLIYNEL